MQNEQYTMHVVRGPFYIGGGAEVKSQVRSQVADHLYYTCIIVTPILYILYTFIYDRLFDMINSSTYGQAIHRPGGQELLGALLLAEEP